MKSIRGGCIVKLILFAGFVFLIFIFAIRKNLRTDALDFLNTLKVNIANVERELFPQRKRPFSLVKQETELKLLLPDPFVNFNSSDWEEFWDLIYGLHGYDISENPRLPGTKRQLTIPELSEKLQLKYPIFTMFQDQHWEEFWKIVLKLKKDKPGLGYR